MYILRILRQFILSALLPGFSGKPYAAEKWHATAELPFSLFLSSTFPLSSEIIIFRLEWVYFTPWATESSPKPLSFIALDI